MDFFYVSTYVFGFTPDCRTLSQAFTLIPSRI